MSMLFMLTNNLEGFLWNLNLSYLMWTIPLPRIILPWCEPCFGLSGCCVHSCLPLGTLRISLTSTDIITALKTSWLWHSSLHSPIPFYQPWLELYSSQEMLLNFIHLCLYIFLFVFGLLSLGFQAYPGPWHRFYQNDKTKMHASESNFLSFKFDCQWSFRVLITTLPLRFSYIPS